MPAAHTPTAAPTTATRKEEALWMLERLVPSGGVNNLTMTIGADGALGAWELRETVDFLLRRHEILRTVFQATDVALFKRVVAADRFRVEIRSHRPRAGQLDAELAAFVAAPFRFDGSPLVRAAHFEAASGDVFCLVVHHLIFDTISSAALLDEFAAVYNAHSEGTDPPAELLEAPPTVTDTPPSAASLAHWREHLRGFDPSGLDLWCGNPEPPAPTLTGEHITHRVPEPARAAVRRLQQELRAPEAVVLLAAYALLLARHGAGPDLVLGSPVSVRPREAAKAVGYHINTLPLRIGVDLDASFRHLVAHTRDVYLRALTHTDVTVDLILPDVRTGTTSSWRNPVFRHLFNYVPDEGRASFDLGGTPAHRLVVENGFSKFDLEFFFLTSADALDVRAVFYTDVLDRTEVALLLERFDTMLLALGADPDRPLDTIAPVCERDRAVIGAANDTARPVRAASVPAAIAETVARTPDAVAVQDGAREVTYARLWRDALATRDTLREAGIGAGAVVALLTGRSADLAAHVLGVWLAGATYLPLDPDHPAPRLAHQLDDSGAAVVIADPDTPVPSRAGRTVLTGPFGADRAPDPAVSYPGPDDCAYLIYTSGSTGRPKGTRITHRSLTNLVEHFADELRVRPGEGTLWMTTFSFDISALELFLPLTRGGRLVVCPDDARTDGKRLAATLERHAVDIVQATPTTWRLVLDDVAGDLAGRRVLSGGEPLPPALARRLAGTGAELYNVYGPTETTIWSTSGRVVEAGPVSVGGPIANTRVFIADPHGRELPIGVLGELCIAGEGVAQGYHDRPDLTADRFREHAEYGRHYRTGDLARWLPDGTIEVLGRLDRQVKVRGNRIELNEVESVLAEHHDVRACAVAVAEDDALVAFVVAPDRDERLRDELWRHAMATLPRAAVPQEYLLVDTFPTTGNDKVDHRALVELARSARADASGAGADGCTGDELVDTLTALWAQFLERTDITAHTNLFTHGGNSLMAARLVQRVEERTSTRLALNDLFANPTPQAFAGRVRAARDTTAHPAESA